MMTKQELQKAIRYTKRGIEIEKSKIYENTEKLNSDHLKKEVYHYVETSFNELYETEEEFYNRVYKVITKQYQDSIECSKELISRKENELAELKAQLKELNKQEKEKGQVFEELTVDESEVLDYFKHQLDNNTIVFKSAKDKLSWLKSTYREIRLYEERRDNSVSFYKLTANIDGKYYPAINKLVEEHYLTTFTGRGGKFYQLGKKGFDYLFLKDN